MEDKFEISFEDMLVICNREPRTEHERLLLAAALNTVKSKKLDELARKQIQEGITNAQ